MTNEHKAVDESLNPDSNSKDEMEKAVFENHYKMIVRGSDRRKKNERRTDPREALAKKSFFGWLRSIFKPRVGVDRRKGDERRQTGAVRLDSNLSAELTQEEIKRLLD